mgnify:CR=1 FL=1
MGDRVKGARDKALADFADNVVRLAKINIGKTYTAKNARGKSYKKRIDNSGKLRNSITSELKTMTEDGRFSKGFIIFKMLEYAYESQETKFIAEMQEAIAQDNAQYISTQIDIIHANSTKKP